MTRRTFCKLFAAAAAAIALPTAFFDTGSEKLAGGEKLQTAGVKVKGFVFHKGQNVGPSEVICWEEWATQREFVITTETDKINSDTWIPKLDPRWRMRSFEVRPIKGSSRAAVSVTYRFATAGPP